MNAPAGLEILSQADCTAKLASGCVGRVGTHRRRDAPRASGELRRGRDGQDPLSHSGRRRCSRRWPGSRWCSRWTASTRTPRRVGACASTDKLSRCSHQAVLPTAQLVERAVVTWAPGPRDRWFTITPTEVTGRRLPMTGVAECSGMVRRSGVVTRVAVVGAGAWGTTLASLLTARAETTLWAREPEVVASIRAGERERAVPPWLRAAACARVTGDLPRSDRRRRARRLRSPDAAPTFSDDTDRGRRSPRAQRGEGPRAEHVHADERGAPRHHAAT